MSKVRDSGQWEIPSLPAAAGWLRGQNWGPTKGGESVAKRTDKIDRYGNIPLPYLGE